MARPSSHIVLHVMKLLVQPLKSLLYRFAVLLMLSGVDEFGDLEDLAGFRIGLAKTTVVPVVVMQI